MPRKLTPEHYDFVNEERAAWDKSRNARRIRQMAREQGWSNEYTEYRKNSAFANFLKKKLEKSGMQTSNALRNFEANVGLLQPKGTGKTLKYLKPNAPASVFEVHNKTIKSFVYSKTSTTKGVSRAREKAIATIKEHMETSSFLKESGQAETSEWDNINLDPNEIIDFFDAFRSFKSTSEYGSNQVMQMYSKIVDEHGKEEVEKALEEIKETEKEKMNRIRAEIKKGVKDVTLRTSAEEFLDNLENIIRRNKEDEDEVGDRL